MGRSGGCELQVRVCEGQGLAAKDSNGLSDPYCHVSLQPGEKTTRHKTKVAYKTLNPAWNESFDFSLQAWRDARLLVECYDWDRFGSHAFMGQCSIALAEAEGQPVDGWFTLLPRKGKGDMVAGKVRIQLTLTVHGEHGRGKHRSATFRSTAPPELLSHLDEGAIHMQEVLFQFIASEAKYGRDLQSLMDHFYHPLAARLPRPLLQSLFLNVEEIYALHLRFLADLQARQAAGAVIGRIGDVWAAYAGKFECYVPFCTENYLATEKMEAARASSSELHQFLEEMREGEGEGADALSSLGRLLKRPKRRLDKYVSFWSEYVHLLGAEHDDRGLVQAALEQIRATVALIARQQQEREFVHATQQLYRQLARQGKYELLYDSQGHMRMMESLAQVTILESGENVPSLALLLEDCILFTRETKREAVQVYHHLGLLSVSVRSLADCIAYKNALEFKTPDLVFIIEMASGEAKSDWMGRIEELQKNLLFEQMRASLPEIDPEASASIIAAQALIEEMGDQLPLEFITALETMLESLDRSLEERQAIEADIDATKDSIQHLAMKRHYLNRSLAHASLAGGPSTTPNSYLPNLLSASGASGAIAESVSTLMKRPATLLQTLSTFKEDSGDLK